MGGCPAAGKSIFCNFEISGLQTYRPLAVVYCDKQQLLAFTCGCFKLQWNILAISIATMSVCFWSLDYPKCISAHPISCVFVQCFFFFSERTLTFVEVWSLNMHYKSNLIANFAAYEDEKEETDQYDSAEETSSLLGTSFDFPASIYWLLCTHVWRNVYSPRQVLQFY